MLHIAVVISGLSGRMHSGFELISRLQREGYQVTCLCQPYTTEIVAKQGFDYLEIPEINFKYSDIKNIATETSWFQKLMHHIKSSSGRYEYGKKLLQLRKYEKIWTEMKPDHVLVDVELHDLIFTAYAAKIPVSLFHTWFSDSLSLGLPPIRTSIIPGKGLGGSTPGIIFARFIDRAKVWGRFYINKLKFQEYRRATIKRYAREIGFPLRDLMISTLPPLYIFKKLPILLLTMRELDFPHQPAKNLKYVGPMVYEKRNDLDKDSHEARRLDEIFESKKASDKKLIYCTVGSLAKGDVSFLKKIIDVVGAENRWILILSLGRNLSSDVFSDLPKNVHLFQWVPQLKVLSNSDCCINHAGINSINECLHYAVPMLIYSLKFTDENGNAARMHYHGLAVVGDKDVDNASQIRENLQRVLNEKSFKNNIMKFQAIYQRYRQESLGPYLFKNP